MHRIIINLALIIFLITSSTEKQTTNSSTLINPIIGNASLASFSREELNEFSEDDKVSAHLKYALGLLQKNNALYKGEVLQKRKQTLALLEDYISYGVFPENVKYPGRRPCFIDNSGNYCAVGYLVKETVGTKMAEEINAKHQYDYIYDMDIKTLDDWIRASGFTKAEIATIQPAYDFDRERKYHAISYTSEIRNGNLPAIKFGYHHLEVWPRTSRGGGHFTKAINAEVTLFGSKGWSGSFGTERSIYAYKQTGLSLSYGLSGNYLNYENQSYLQGAPKVAINWMVRKFRKITYELSSGYTYGIPLWNQSPLALNRHAFEVKLKIGLIRKS